MVKLRVTTFGFNGEAVNTADVTADKASIADMQAAIRPLALFMPVTKLRGLTHGKTMDFKDASGRLKYRFEIIEFSF